MTDTVKWKRWTALLIVAVIVGLIVYDLIAYAVAGNDATISKVMLTINQEHPAFGLMFTFSFGVLVGHLFLPQTVTVNDVQ